MKIRQYESKDLENCREICYVTSKGFDTPGRKQALFNMYIDYYAEHERDTCFVAADENDEAVGYVICAKDYKHYEKTYRKYYNKSLRKNSFSLWVKRQFDLVYSRKLAKHYPAHLHINISPKAQRQGLGHKLVDTLIEKLRAENVPGLYLGVGSSNQTGMNFYRKYGFREYKRLPGVVVFVIDIDKN